MIYIAHRGNHAGPRPDQENSPDYLMAALAAGYEAEVDVWYEDKRFYLGHDQPQYPVDLKFLANPKFWCHAKNLPAFLHLLDHDLIHCFWHDYDLVALTSKHYLWTFPGGPVTTRTICVLPEDLRNRHCDWRGGIGICSDYITNYHYNHDH